MKYLVAVLLCLSGVYAHAGTYWVSPTGSASWSGGGNCQSATPLSGTSACSMFTAFLNAAADDIVNARGGTYNLGSGDGSVDYLGNHLCDLCGYFQIVNAGTNGHPITFQAYSGEAPILHFTYTGGTPYLIKVIRLNSYVIFSGFTLQDSGNNTFAVCICGSDSMNHLVGTIFKNNTMIGWSNAVPGAINNFDMVRFEKCNFCAIQNNNLGPLTTDTLANGDVSFIKIYDVENSTITNNEMHDSIAIGISIKSYTINLTISYNYIHSIGQPWKFNSYLAQGHSNMQVYHNVMVSSSAAASMFYDIEAGTYADTGMMFYNNTVYNSQRSGMIADTNASPGSFSSYKHFNNIFYTADVSGRPSLDLYDAGNKTMAEEDHNNYYRSGGAFYMHWGNNYNSLAAWQTSGILEGGGNPGTYLGTPNTDVAADPLFANASGQFSKLSDFNLCVAGQPGCSATSPSRGTGRGGVDMGAQICAVGPNASCTGSGVATVPPAAPRGFTLQ